MNASFTERGLTGRLQLPTLPALADELAALAARVEALERRLSRES